MDTYFGLFFSIGLVCGLIESVGVGFWFKSFQPCLWVIVGATVGTIMLAAVCVLNPSIPYHIAFWSMAGKDVFGSTLFVSFILSIMMVVFGSVLGGLIGLSVWLKFFPN
jgi:hypothetical protein